MCEFSRSSVLFVDLEIHCQCQKLEIFINSASGDLYTSKLDANSQRHIRRYVFSAASLPPPPFKFGHKIVNRLMHTVRYLAYFTKHINDDVSDFCIVTVGNPDNRTKKSKTMTVHTRDHRKLYRLLSRESYFCLLILRYKTYEWYEQEHH